MKKTILLLVLLIFCFGGCATSHTYEQNKANKKNRAGYPIPWDAGFELYRKRTKNALNSMIDRRNKRDNTERTRNRQNIIEQSRRQKNEFSDIVTDTFSSAKDYVKKGYSYYINSELMKAAAYFYKAITIDDNYQLAHLWLGTAYDDLGSKEKAIQKFRKTIEINSLTKEADLAKKKIKDIHHR